MTVPYIFKVTCFGCKLIRIIPTIIICVLLYYIYTHCYNMDCKCNKKENFTPRMREMYRPYLRGARVVSEGFYGDGENNINRLFRKFGLY
jgi:hypothetical protein